MAKCAALVEAETFVVEVADIVRSVEAVLEVVRLELMYVMATHLRFHVRRLVQWTSLKFVARKILGILFSKLPICNDLTSVVLNGQDVTRLRLYMTIHTMPITM